MASIHQVFLTCMCKTLSPMVIRSILASRRKQKHLTADLATIRSQAVPLHCSLFVCFPKHDIFKSVVNLSNRCLWSQLNTLGRNTREVCIIVNWAFIMCPCVYQFSFMKRWCQLTAQAWVLCSHKLFKCPPHQPIMTSLWPRLKQPRERDKVTYLGFLLVVIFQSSVLLLFICPYLYAFNYTIYFYSI